MNIKTGILVDPMGHGMGEVSPEQEVKDHIKEYSELLRPHTLSPYRLKSAYQVKLGTKLILFDYGGMMPGSGDLVSGEARQVIRWAEDNPSGLVVVVSDFTYRRVIRGEMEELGLNLYNVVHRESLFADPIPLWFRMGDKFSVVLHPTAGLMPIGGTLPDQQWFKPEKRFITWFKKNFEREFVYELGAGMGHTSKALSESGLRRVKAIDANIRVGAVYPVEIQDATNLDYDMEPVVLICRPCHGSFVEASIQQALTRRARAIVYVGLPKNVKADLGIFYRQFKCELKESGKEGEFTYCWRPEWNQDTEKPKKARLRKP